MLLMLMLMVASRLMR